MQTLIIIEMVFSSEDAGMRVKNEPLRLSVKKP